MAVIVDGKRIECEHIYVDGKMVDDTYCDGVKVHDSPCCTPPGAITNFTASDDLDGAIRFDWGYPSGTEPFTFDLYRDDFLVAEDVLPTIVLLFPGGASGNFRVKARNECGTVYSNWDYGSCKARCGVLTWVGGGSKKWYGPYGISHVKICACAAGGDSIKPPSNGRTSYGGYAGEVAENMIFGVTHAEECHFYVPSNSLSNDGDTMLFRGRSDEVVLKGGEDGQCPNSDVPYEPEHGYRGDGGSVTNCNGTFYDGKKYYYDTSGNTYWGGEACFGNGGDNKNDTDGGHGAGGAGGGDGGPGYVRMQCYYLDSKDLPENIRYAIGEEPDDETTED
jgi:hypothetical protein